MSRLTRNRIDAEDVFCVYRRSEGSSVYVRDRQGRYNVFSIYNDQAVILPGGITTLGPVYNRVDYKNNIRHTGRTRSQSVLKAEYNNAKNFIKSGWVFLPDEINHSRRNTNQGMDNAMKDLTGDALSATEYVKWASLKGSAINAKEDCKWEWCHLIAHSMGGADSPENIVAATVGNNSEQLAIESALQMFRRENVFSMHVSAALLGSDDARHVGNVIRYEIRCSEGGEEYVRYLDCLNAPNPSEIHYYEVLEEVALWANKKLLGISNINRWVSHVERNVVINYIRQNNIAILN